MNDFEKGNKKNMEESMKFNSQVGTSNEQSQRLLINPNNRSLDFDNINEYAKKFRLSGERSAFLEGVRLGFSWATERYVEYLSEFEKRRTNNIIVVKNNEIK
jgi:hypothetical protein